MDINKNTENENTLFSNSNDLNLDLNRLARVYRKSKELGLSNILEDKLSTSSTTPTLDSNLNSSSILDQNLKTPTVSTTINNSFSKNSNVQKDFDLKQYLLKIRQMVYLEKSWDDIKLYAWPVFRYEKTDKRASDLIEYAFLYGSIQDVLEVIDMLELEFGSRSYYGCIHEAIRTQLLLILWKNNLDNSIKHLITESLDIEKLYKLSTYLKNEDSKNLFSYFIENKEPILQALNKYSGFLNIKKGFILCKIAKIAISLKQYQEAEKILREIPCSDPDYTEAIEILINIATLSLSPEDEKYLSLILKEPRWSVRLELIEQLLKSLDTTNKESGFNQFLTVKTLTIFFTNPYKYIPNSFQSNTSLIQLISKYFGTYIKVPSLFNVLKILASDFKDSLSSKSIWDYIEKNWNDSTLSIKRYWYAVAYTHLFYLNLRQDDKTFYKSRRILEHTNINLTTPYSWNELYSFMCSQVLNLDTSYKHKTKIQQILRLVSNNFSYLNYKDISSYLDNLSDLDEEILNSLQSILQKNSDLNTELKLIRYRMNLYGISSEDLKRIWTIASLSNKLDLAWRVATVLKSRDELNIEIEKIWRLSGENRTNYPIIQIDDTDVQQIIFSSKKNDSDFLKSFMNLGKKLGELFLIIDPSYTKKRFNYKNKKDSRFKDIFINLKNIDNKYYIDLKENKNDNNLNKNQDTSNDETSTISSLYNIVSYRLFSFMLEKDFNLNIKKINQVLPKLANDLTLEKESKPLFNWLRSLNPSQRLSWTQFSNSLKSRNIDDLTTVMISFIYKMIVVIYPNHLAVLDHIHSQYQDKKSYKTIQDECIQWILSDKYFSLREKYKLSSQTPISKTLKNL